VRALQELQYASNIAGISQGEFEMSIRQLANGAQDAARGVGTFAQAYQKLGINPVDHGKLKQTDQILMEMADRFSRMPDSLEKTALANDIFGRSGMRLIPFLNRGAAGIAALRAEAESLGVVLDEQSVKQSEEFNISLKRLWASITGIKNQIGVGLMPAITGIIEDMRAWVAQNKELIKSTLQEYIKGTVALLKTMYTYAKSGVEAIKGLAGAFGGLNKILKTVTITLCLFIGLSILHSIGLIAQGVYGLVAAFWALSAAEMAAAAAGAAASALPLLIGGAIVGLLFVLEDLWRYSRGDKSVFGLLVEGAKKAFPKVFGFATQFFTDLKGTLSGIKDLIKGLFTFDVAKIKQGLREVINAFSETFDEIKAISSARDKAQSEARKGKFLGSIGLTGANNAWQSLIGGWMNFVQNATGMNTTLPVTSSSVSNRNVNAPSTITYSPVFNLNGGGNAQEIIEQVEPHFRGIFRDEIGTLLRQSYTPTGEEY
jgi:hypothetical protein